MKRKKNQGKLKATKERKEIVRYTMQKMADWILTQKLKDGNVFTKDGVELFNFTCDYLNNQINEMLKNDVLNE